MHISHEVAPVVTIPLEVTGRISDAGIGVLSFILMDGSKHIVVERIENADRFTAMSRVKMNVRAKRREISDWQSCWFESPQAAAAGIIDTFGLYWFNQARAQLAKLGWKPRNDIAEAEEAGREAFGTVGGRMSDGKGFDWPRCPYRRPERIAAWERGLNEMFDAFNDVMAEVA